VKILFLPVWLFDLVRLAGLRELSPRERRRKILAVSGIFIGFAYLPLIVGLLIAMKIQVWWIWAIPLPLTGTWPVNLVLFFYFNLVLNLLTRRSLSFVPMEERVKIALVRCSFRVPSIEGGTVEYPEILAVDHRRVILEGKGFTPTYFESKRAELSSAAGVFFWNAQAARNKFGESLPGVVELFYTKGDLPSFIPWEVMPLPAWGELVIGLGMNGFRIIELDKSPHIGIAGLTGKGKSYLLRSLIVQVMLVYRNSCIVCLDFKQGAEFARLRGFGNFLFCRDFEVSGICLDEVYQEYLRRADFLAGLDVDSVYEIIGPQGQRVNPVFIFCDELSEIYNPLLKTASAEARSGQALTWERLNQLARMGRVAGVHIIAATQRPDAKTVDTQVRSSLETRIAFKMQQLQDSTMWLNRGAALDLPGNIRGRFLLETESGIFEELQGIAISKEEARARLAGEPVGTSQLYQRIIRAIAQGREGAGAEPQRRARLSAPTAEA